MMMMMMMMLLPLLLLAMRSAVTWSGQTYGTARFGSWMICIDRFRNRSETVPGAKRFRNSGHSLRTHAGLDSL
uniref:Putative secreted protein n=1 Tax=Anopheles marajoara TaxID=58244 RepID=A0A2M4CDM6_9DIPT